MSYEKPEARWRQWLTDAELARVTEIEAAEDNMKALRVERQLIANRAIQRARYAERTKAKNPPAGN